MNEADRDRFDGRALRDRRTGAIELAVLLVCLAIAGYFVWKMFKGLEI